MLKSPLTYLFVLVLFALSACVSASEEASPSPTALPATSESAKIDEPTASPVAADGDEPTAPPVATESDEPTAAPVIAEGDEPGCSVVGSIAPEPLANSPIPSASTADWRAGPTDAKVTIIEYGDFQ